MAMFDHSMVRIHRRFTSRFLAATLTFLALLAGAQWVLAFQPASEVPSESVLPAYLQSSPSDLVFASESALPTGFAQQRAQPKPIQSPFEAQPQPSETPLPSESQLPAAGDATAAQPDLQQPGLAQLLEQSRDRLPWLRLTEAEQAGAILDQQQDGHGRVEQRKRRQRYQDQGLQARPRQIGDKCGQYAIQPLTVLVFRYRARHTFRRFHQRATRLRKQP